MSDNLEARPSPRPLEWPPILTELQAILSDRIQPLYLVGGSVRDTYLRRPIHDLDFVTADDGKYAAKKVANRLHGSYYPLDTERGVGRAIVEYQGERFVIDVARERGNSLADDLVARDFTINALAVPLDSDLQQIIDPLGGLADLARKRLRRCSPDSIGDDPLRALRAVRQSVALNLLIEPETRSDLRRYGSRLTQTSVERVRDEFMNILGGPRPHVALRTLDALGLLKLIVPEIEAMKGVSQSPPHIFDVWEHTLKVVERLDGVLTTISPARTSDSAADAAYGMIVYLMDRFRRSLQDHLVVPFANGRAVQALLVLGALLHDCAKPQTRSVDETGRIHFYQHENVGAEMALARAVALRLSNEETSRIEAMVHHHMRPMHLHRESQLSRRAIYRFWNTTGALSGIDVCILTQADYLGMVGSSMMLQDWIQHLQTVGTLLDGFFNQCESLVSPPLLVNGHDLMAHFSLTSSPEIGRLLRSISEAQAVGEVSTVEQALALARSLLDTPPNGDS